jgi:hypothetical protein
VFVVSDADRRAGAVISQKMPAEAGGGRPSLFDEWLDSREWFVCNGDPTCVVRHESNT